MGVVVLAWSSDGEIDDLALQATLQSLRDQIDGDFEVAVVHAGPAVLRTLDDPRFRVVTATMPDDGPVALLETGRSALATDWIRFLPLGDRLAPGCIAAERAALEEERDLAAVFSGVESVRADGSLRAEEDPRGRVRPGRWEAGRLVPEMLEGNPLPLGSALLSRDVLTELGGFDASFGARFDHELWLRLLAGWPVRVLSGRGFRMRLPRVEPPDPRVDAAEHVRLLLDALRSDALEAVVRELGGGERWSPSQGIARAELARRLLRTGHAELRPLAIRLVREARAAGAYFPADAPFEEIADLFPELARPEGWFAPDAVPSPLPGEPCVVGSGSFPPSIRVALCTGGKSPGGVPVERLVSLRERLLERGIELLVLHARGGGDAVSPSLDVSTEILRHRGSVDEAERVLLRCGVSVVIAAPGHPGADAARRRGLAVLPSVPRIEDAARFATTLIREASWSAARFRREADGRSRDAARAADAELADQAVLRTLVGALGAAASALGAPPPGGNLLDRLGDVRRDARGAQRRAREVRERTGRALDKLRIGRRLRTALGGTGSLPVAGTGRVVSLDEAAVERFLAAASSAAPGRLWVVYTTDPYSETQGQRSTWLARELLARGDFVVFVYWRWRLSEQIAAAPTERLLSVPIDQFFRVQRPLMDLTVAGLDKVFLIEFPDAYLFEQIDLAGAHGFTTVYDCVDDWEEFARVGQAHWYEPSIERHLVRCADAVAATHPVLAERLERMGRPPGSVVLVPNGVAPDLLTGHGHRSRSGPPLIGYFGHLTPAWFDWDLIAETARGHPQWTFEIVGHGAPDALDLPGNVRVPGPVPHDTLERRTRAWSVGIVPFLPGRLTRAVDPIKLYEYLALGLPAVVVDMPHLRGVPGVEVCSREDFASAVARALTAEPDWGEVSRFVAASTWSARADALCDVVARGARADLLKAL